MQEVKWGIIGAGNVVEKKCGLLLNSIKKSSISAIMGRNINKTAALAKKLGVHQYYSNIDDLLNDERLLNRADSLGYKIRFMPHPNVINYIDWFDRNDYVEFLNISTKYRDIFSTSGLVVTDYSSIAFDFAYLRKPVVYAQFDKEEFFAGHTYDQGYFDYERDGFGEVEYNLKSTSQTFPITLFSNNSFIFINLGKAL